MIDGKSEQEGNWKQIKINIQSVNYKFCLYIQETTLVSFSISFQAKKN